MANTRKQFLAESALFRGEHYGPGYVDVPEDFPQPQGAEAEATSDAEAMSAFEANKDEFLAWQRQKREAVNAQNDAGVAQPQSGDWNAPSTATGSNQGAQTGVLDGAQDPNAAGAKDGDPLSPEKQKSDANVRTTVGDGSRAPGVAASEPEAEKPAKGKAKPEA